MLVAIIVTLAGFVVYLAHRTRKAEHRLFIAQHRIKTVEAISQYAVKKLGDTGDAVPVKNEWKDAIFGHCFPACLARSGKPPHLILEDIIAWHRDDAATLQADEIIALQREIVGLRNELVRISKECRSLPVGVSLSTEEVQEITKAWNEMPKYPRIASGQWYEKSSRPEPIKADPRQGDFRIASVPHPVDVDRDAMAAEGPYVPPCPQSHHTPK